MKNNKFKSRNVHHLILLGRLCDINGQNIAAAMLGLAYELRYGEERLRRICDNFRVSTEKNRKDVMDSVYHQIVLKELDRIGISFRSVRDTVTLTCEIEDEACITRLAENLCSFFIDLNRYEGIGRQRIMAIMAFMRGYKGNAIEELNRKFGAEFFTLLNGVLPDIPEDFKPQKKTDISTSRQLLKELNALREFQGVN